ncbi:DUF92 domain-containing protein [Sporosalibacterium faouarense]|uniref:DUF92 domain-containing protein n=1 Tax=Sporosalibacterium faouarense TaxID=516123 RepID=UPI00141C9323|nr:DUF92 domain-containing protein [Sporosalibacterium faouarense]MTI46452.1 DUF92 domain-containing protein [Bacillota bacterium]
MEMGLWGMVSSIVFVLIIIAISETLKVKMKLSNEATRKFIHIGVSHWWIFSMIFIPEIEYAIIPPILFIILNYISYKKSVFKSMERNESKADLGTIYFPVSLLFLIILTWKNGLLGNNLKYIGAVGILVMGYGDGFAAIIGKKLGKNKIKIYNNVKSLEGSITMFILSYLVALLILIFSNGYSFKILAISFILAVIATVVEALTPWGLDNLTVPLITALSAYFLLKISIQSQLFNILLRGGIGLIFSVFIAYVAYNVESLSVSGSIGAIILGTGIFATSGIYGAALMILFFISSSILSHFKKSKKKSIADQFDKTGKRDIIQVFANGGVGLIFSILYAITGNVSFLVVVAISYAAANADTWSTELGVLNNSKPLSLRTFRRVAKGTSGAVSLWGTLAGFFGSAFISVSFVILISIIGITGLDIDILSIFLIVAICGFLGGIIDSILGATVQGIYYSDEAARETEKKVYRGKPTKLIRGVSYFNNDLVNFLSIGLAACISLGILI